MYAKSSNYNSNDYLIYKELSIRDLHYIWKYTWKSCLKPMEWLLSVWTTYFASFSGIFTTTDVILNKWKAFITKLRLWIINSFQEKIYLFLII